MKQFLSRIYALLSVKFSGLKSRLCKKSDKYEVCLCMPRYYHYTYAIEIDSGLMVLCVCHMERSRDVVVVVVVVVVVRRATVMLLLLLLMF